MKCKLSIIIPIYNMERYLDQCLSSITRQNFPDEVEVICVDDGSKDSSLSICEKYAKKYKYIKIYHKENGGVSSARNLGLDKSRGEYIAWIDPDDYIDDNWFEKIEVYMRDEIDVIFYDYTRFGAEERVCRYSDVSSPISKAQFLEDLYKNHRLQSHLWNKVIKKQFWDNVRFDENVSLWEDYCALTNVVKEIKSVYYLNSLLYYYRMHKKSIVHTCSFSDSLRTVDFVQERYNVFKEQGVNISNIGIIWTYFHIIKSYLKRATKEEEKIYNDKIEYMCAQIVANKEAFLKEYGKSMNMRFKIYLIEKKWLFLYKGLLHFRILLNRLSLKN